MVNKDNNIRKRITCKCITNLNQYYNAKNVSCKKKELDVTTEKLRF